MQESLARGILYIACTTRATGGTWKSEFMTLLSNKEREISRYTKMTFSLYRFGNEKVTRSQHEVILSVARSSRYILMLH